MNLLPILQIVGCVLAAGFACVVAFAWHLSRTQRTTVVVHPERDPLSGQHYFALVDHPTLGKIPTYGGPETSSTLLQRDAGGKYFRDHYNHKEGRWWSAEVLLPEHRTIQELEDELLLAEERIAAAYLVLLGDKLDNGPDLDAYVDGQVEDLEVLIRAALKREQEAVAERDILRMAVQPAGAELANN